MGNVPTFLWYLVALLAMAWIAVLIQYYQLDLKLKVYWKRIETVINRIPVRKLSGDGAVTQINRLHEKISQSELKLLANVFEPDSIEINRTEIATWKDLGEMSDGTENSDSQTAAVVHGTGDQNDK